MSPGRSSDMVPYLQVNGVCMEGKQHADVVAAIKAGGDETRLLVVDVLTDEFFKKCKVVPSEEHLAGGLGAVLWREVFVSPLLAPCHFVPKPGGAGESLSPERRWRSCHPREEQSHPALECGAQQHPPVLQGWL